MVKKNRSKGVTLGGIITISRGLALITPCLNPSRLSYILSKAYPSPLQLVYLISSAILLGFIIAGAQILRLKELGRSLIVYLAIIDIPHLIVGKAIYHNYEIEPVYLRSSALITVGIAMNLILIYFFNRPKVKAQFSQSQCSKPR